MPITTTRERLVVGETTKPRLPSYVRLQHDPVRGAWALLSPEKVMWPDDISLEILRRCDGYTSTGEIIDGLAREYDAEPDMVRGDVIEFLQTWADRRLVTA